MTDLHTWATRWHVPPEALAELAALTLTLAESDDDDLFSEAGVNSRITVQASKNGDWVGRNNCGVLKNDRGNFVRFGLANISKRVNNIIKTGDFIGWKTRLITAADLPADGTPLRIAQFMSIEAKKPGWKYTGKGREMQQQAWAMFVRAAGGIAVFVTGPEGLP